MSREEILAQLKSGKIKVEEAATLLAAQMATKSTGKLYCKVSPKGAVSVYGLGQWPLTLYVEQWERLESFMGELKEFVKKWEGKDYTSERATERGGKKVPYTVRIAHKGAAA